MPTLDDLEQLRLRLQRARAGEPLIIETSGSTESPKRVALSWTALVAAADASAQVIGSGAWLLTLPTEYVAGAMVDVRAQRARAVTAVANSGEFVAAATVLPSPKYVSLVPAQLAELLTDPSATAALAGFEAVLVGGQRLPASVRTAAERAGVRVIATYGSTETSGGCVYDGRPLPGVQLRVDEDDRLWVSGPMLADGYLTQAGDLDVERTAAAFIEHDGRRWYRTDDRARLHTDDDGVRLEILGRTDDVIISGGLKLDLAEVQRFLDQLLGEGAALALPIDGTRWGQSLGVQRFDTGIGAIPAVDDAQLSAALIERFGRAARPVIGGGCALMTVNGKPDRQAYQRELHSQAAHLGLIASMDGDE